tara:strand:+ start:803 stop:2791 length:1989 start_codon:yes stop_codon:yes gene_type:complete
MAKKGNSNKSKYKKPTNNEKKILKEIMSDVINLRYSEEEEVVYALQKLKNAKNKLRNTVSEEKLSHWAFYHVRQIKDKNSIKKYYLFTKLIETFGTEEFENDISDLRNIKFKIKNMNKLYKSIYNNKSFRNEDESPTKKQRIKLQYNKDNFNNRNSYLLRRNKNRKSSFYNLLDYLYQGYIRYLSLEKENVITRKNEYNNIKNNVNQKLEKANRESKEKAATKIQSIYRRKKNRKLAKEKKEAKEKEEREAREKAEQESKEKAEQEAKEKENREAKEKANREVREKILNIIKQSINFGFNSNNNNNINNISSKKLDKKVNDMLRKYFSILENVQKNNQQDIINNPNKKIIHDQFSIINGVYEDLSKRFDDVTKTLTKKTTEKKEKKNELKEIAKQLKNEKTKQNKLQNKLKEVEKEYQQKKREEQNLESKQKELNNKKKTFETIKSKFITIFYKENNISSLSKIKDINNIINSYNEYKEITLEKTTTPEQIKQGEQKKKEKNNVIFKKSVEKRLKENNITVSGYNNKKINLLDYYLNYLNKKINLSDIVDPWEKISFVNNYVLTFLSLKEEVKNKEYEEFIDTEIENILYYFGLIWDDYLKEDIINEYKSEVPTYKKIGSSFYKRNSAVYSFDNDNYKKFKKTTQFDKQLRYENNSKTRHKI